MSSWMLSCERVFLIRRAVSRAAPLAYQHSRMIFPITLSACGEKTQIKQFSSLSHKVCLRINSWILLKGCIFTLKNLRWYAWSILHSKMAFQIGKHVCGECCTIICVFLLLAWSTVIISSTCTSPKSHVLTELWLVTENVKVGGSRAK